MDKDYITRAEFEAVIGAIRAVVYGLAGITLTAVLVAVLTAVIK